VTATALNVAQELPLRAATTPTVAISICEPVIASIDPAYGTDIEGLPCQALDADLWFAETPMQLDEAKALCHGCPVRLGCLAGALDRREPWGVWGGEIFEHGSVIARKRPRGRPRKNEVAA
jgi:WhiB family redox-sensing transcriptional regulator